MRYSWNDSTCARLVVCLVLVLGVTLPGGASSAELQLGSDTPASLNIVLVDTTLDDYEQLIDAAADDATVIRYDGDSESMTDVLARVEGLSESSDTKIGSLSILSHGTGGELDLGNELVSSDMSDEQLAAWRSLADNFAEGANISPTAATSWTARARGRRCSTP